MRDIFIDVETYSSVDIQKCGAYKYVESPDFEILLISYAFTETDEIRTIDLACGDAIPEEFEEALFDPTCRKHAHNAVFERLCFKRIGYDVPAEEWYCTSVKAGYCGLPLGLDQVSKALDIVNKKLDTGKALIKYFSCPCKPTKVNGGRTRNYPRHAPEKWELYKEYNQFDVRAEREIYFRLAKYEIPYIERQIYVLDQDINDRGILVDKTLVDSAIYMDDVYKQELTEEAKRLTGLDNPNSIAQIKKWLETKISSYAGEFYAVESLAKEAFATVEDDCKKFNCGQEIFDVLTIKKRLSKTSVKKYYAMQACAMADGRVRGTFQFYGANRTGRWAGRLLQLQNLAKNHLNDIDEARALVRDKDIDMVEIMYDDVSDILSQLIRTAIIAPEGKILSVADFSAIEARVISWLANEEWRMEVFRGDGKIYEATGSKMFNVPISAITKGSDLRQKSKISELALGYEGAIGALRRMGGDKMGLSDAEMMSLVRKWRTANPAIVDMWHEIEACAHEAVRYQREVIGTPRNLVFNCDGEFLTIQLPSGRKLFYNKPHFRMKTTGRSTSKTLCYMGMNQETKKWCEVDTYGGKLTENIVQAIARDLLAFAMLNLAKAGYKITMHVHDEAIAEIPFDGHEREYYDNMVKIMSKAPDWASDLPLNADGYITTFYKKD